MESGSYNPIGMALILLMLVHSMCFSHGELSRARQGVVLYPDPPPKRKGGLKGGLGLRLDKMS